MSSLTVGFLQYSPERGNVAANVDRVQGLAVQARADLIVLPELANSGYMYSSPESIAPFSERADGSGPFLSALINLAVRLGGIIVTGFAERAPEGLYNSAVAVSSGGVIAHYRKTHLFSDEKTLFLPGDTGFGVFGYAGARIGLMICFDWYFPESARTLALRGAQIIAHPSNLVLGHCQTAMITRCLENRAFAITSNRYGIEDLGGKHLTFTGASQVISPKGERLLSAPEQGDCLAAIEIDPKLADDKQPAARNDLFLDRRPEMYQ